MGWEGKALKRVDMNGHETAYLLKAINLFTYYIERWKSNIWSFLKMREDLMNPIWLIWCWRAENRYWTLFDVLKCIFEVLEYQIMCWISVFIVKFLIHLLESCLISKKWSIKHTKYQFHLWVESYLRCPSSGLVRSISCFFKQVQFLSRLTEKSHKGQFPSHLKVLKVSREQKTEEKHQFGVFFICLFHLFFL